MPGFMPGIHAFAVDQRSKDVDGRVILGLDPRMTRRSMMKSSVH
jgi:hypothetical protein